MRNPTTLTLTQKNYFLDYLKTNPRFALQMRRIADCPDFGFEPQPPDLAPRDWAGPRLFGVTGRYRMLFASAAVLGSDGRASEALELWRTGWKSSRHFLEHPANTSTLMLGLLAREMAFPSLWSILRNQEPGPDLLRQIMADLDPPGFQPQVIHSLDRLRAIDILVRMDVLREGESRPPQRQREGMRGERGERGERNAPLSSPLAAREPGWNQRFWHWLLRPTLLWNLVRSQDTYDAIRAVLAKEPWFWEKELDQIESGLKKMPDWLFESRSLSFFTQTAPGRYLPVEARCQAARLALSCRIWRGEKGTWPASLGQLAPGILPRLPVDPFTGNPFFYVLKEKGFLIYSAGPNGVDDGAAPDSDDIVWAEGINMPPPAPAFRMEDFRRGGPRR